MLWHCHGQKHKHIRKYQRTQCKELLVFNSILYLSVNGDSIPEVPGKEERICPREVNSPSVHTRVHTHTRTHKDPFSSSLWTITITSPYLVHFPFFYFPLDTAVIHWRRDASLHASIQRQPLFKFRMVKKWGNRPFPSKKVHWFHLTWLSVSSFFSLPDHTIL